MNKQLKIFITFIVSAIITMGVIFVLSILYNLLFVISESGKATQDIFNCNYGRIIHKCSFGEYTKLFFEPLYVILWSPLILILASIETASILKKKK